MKSDSSLHDRQALRDSRGFRDVLGPMKGSITTTEIPLLGGKFQKTEAAQQAFPCANVPPMLAELQELSNREAPLSARPGQVVCLDRCYWIEYFSVALMPLHRGLTDRFLGERHL